MSLEEDPDAIHGIQQAAEDEAAMQVDDVPSSKTAGKTNSRKTVQLPDGQPGITTLPVARVQRIVKADKEIQMVNKEAIFALSVVTEHFIKRLTDKAYEQARMDQRKNVTLKDMSTAIRNYPEFEFLNGIVPETVPLSVALAARAKKAVEDAEGPTDESTTKLADVFPKVSLVPSTDPEHPDYLVKKAAGGQAKKTKGAPISVVNGEKDKGKSKETTPVNPNGRARPRRSRGAANETEGEAEIEAEQDAEAEGGPSSDVPE